MLWVPALGVDLAFYVPGVSCLHGVRITALMQIRGANLTRVNTSAACQIEPEEAD